MIHLRKGSILGLKDNSTISTAHQIAVSLGKSQDYHFNCINRFPLSTTDEAYAFPYRVHHVGLPIGAVGYQYAVKGSVVGKEETFQRPVLIIKNEVIFF